MRFFASLCFFAVLGAAAILCAQNVESVNLHLLTWTVLAPLWLVAAGGYVCSAGGKSRAS
jgi:uncharacterized integral membrane protein